MLTVNSQPDVDGPFPLDCVIRAAYKALRQHHHPDKMASAASEAPPACMTEINEAYGVLSDEEKRRTYDARRRAPDVASLGARTIGLRCLIIAGSFAVADLAATEVALGVGRRHQLRRGQLPTTSCTGPSACSSLRWGSSAPGASDDEQLTISVVTSGTDNGIESVQPSFPCLVGPDDHRTLRELPTF